MVQAKKSAPKNALKLPALAEFERKSAELQPNAPAIQRVAGLDYDQWASAVIDLNSSAASIARQRRRLDSKGYIKLEDSPLVGGFDNPEVWVIPRANWIKNRAGRHARIVAAVESGLMQDSAISTGNVIKKKK